jgi:hypothetical protein
VIPFFAITLAAPIGASAHRPSSDTVDVSVVYSLLVPVLLFGLHCYRRFGRITRAAWMVLAITVVALESWRLGSVVAMGIQSPPEWDFMAFWIPARAAVHHLNFYDPRSYHSVVDLSLHTPEFRAEILRVGFWYPPSSMLLLLPLGTLTRGEAAPFWFAFLLLGLVASIVALWRSFPSLRGLFGLATCAALVLLFPATLTTVWFAQTNFLELLALTLLWRDRDRPRAGWWLALAVMIKPFALVLLPFLGAGRRRAGLALAAIALAVSMLIAVLAFGARTCWTFVASSPMSRLPDYVFSQTINQSLWATLLRLRGLDESLFDDGPRLELLVAGLIVVAITAWAALRRNLDERLSFALLLTVGLILYPASLEHYSMVLVLPFLMCWDAYAHWRARTVVGLVALVVYVLVGAGSVGVFCAYAVAWVALLLTAARATIPLPGRARIA